MQMHVRTESCHMYFSIHRHKTYSTVCIHCTGTRYEYPLVASFIEPCRRSCIAMFCTELWFCDQRIGSAAKSRAEVIQKTYVSIATAVMQTVLVLYNQRHYHYHYHYYYNTSICISRRTPHDADE